MALKWFRPVGASGDVQTVPTTHLEFSFDSTEEDVDREKFNAHAEYLAGEMIPGTSWPALVVRRKRGSDGLIVMDGDHRLAALRRLGIESVGVVE